MKIAIPPALLRPRLLYGAFAALAFVLALRWTFPSEAVKERLIYEAGTLGWQIDVRAVRPHALLGVRMDGVALTDSAGLTVQVERLDASLRVLPLLLGRRVLDYGASLYGGSAEGRADLSGKERRLELKLAGLELARVLPLAKAAGMGLSGQADGEIDLVLPGGALERATGSVRLGVTRAGLAGGQVAALMNQSLPPLALGTVAASAKVDQGRMAVEKLEVKGGDVELTGRDVTAVLQRRLEYSPLAGEGQLRLQPSLWQKPEAGKYRPLVEAGLVRFRSSDGSYKLPLGGTLGHPSLRQAGGGATASPPAGGAARRSLEPDDE